MIIRSMYAVVAWLFLFNTLFSQTTYYISMDGDDEDDGQSELTPWETIDKVNAIILSPGDKILFERGGICIYTGQIEISQSGTPTDPITIGAYGEGAHPVISGATIWTIIL